MTVALVAMSLGTLAMCLGLMRWPSVHWALAEAYAQGGAETRAALDTVFTGLNTYLGNYIGEFLGEVMLAVFFLCAGVSMREEPNFPRWSAWTGIVFALLFVVGALRNVTPAVQPIADLNNTLLPLWMIALGVVLIRFSRRSGLSETSG